MYDVVNRANWLIASLEKLSDNDFESPGRRSEIIAEAKFSGYGPLLSVTVIRSVL
jgi:hypothetical protein